MLRPHKSISNLMKPLTERNERLATESPQEKIKRIKNKFGLYHGKGKSKNKKHNKKKQ